MSKTGSAAKVKLNSFDDLFGTEQPQTGTEQVQEIALSELHEFKGHPFKVLDDEKMQETMESIREHGVLMPGIARPMKDGGYEIIAGHRRRHACELVGLTTMPMFIRDYTDDEATIIMVDSNIQREDILPSEKAKAYFMKYEAVKHQGKCQNNKGKIKQHTIKLNTHPKGQPRNRLSFFYADRQKGATNYDKTERENP